MISIYLLDDDISFINDFQEICTENGGFVLEYTQNVDSFISRMVYSTNESKGFDICFVDQDLKQRITGIDVIREVRQRRIALPIVLLTHLEDYSIPFLAGQSGATIFCKKDELFQIGNLNKTVEAAILKCFQTREAVTQVAEERYLGVVHLVDEFIHDTKNVFIPIIQSVQVAKDTFESCAELCGENEARMALEELGLIKGKADIGLANLNHLDEFVQSGSPDLSIANVDMREFLEGCVSEVFLGKRPVEIDAIADHALFDEHAVRRIIRALLNNIEDHVDPSVKVEISANTSTFQSIRFLRFCVRDFGQGIPEHLIGRLFYPGVVGSESKNSGNKGLGLSIAQKYSQLHRIGKFRGQVHYKRPDVGDGSLFIVELPIGEE